MTCEWHSRRAAQAREYRKRNPERASATARRMRTLYSERIRAAKKNPCMDCGQSFPPECMEFDHVRGVKERSGSKLHSVSRAGFEAEIAKCDLVCANCHRLRTTSRRLALP